MEANESTNWTAVVVIVVLIAACAGAVWLALPSLAVRKSANVSREHVEFEQMCTVVAIEVTATAQAGADAKDAKVEVDQGLVRDVMAHDYQMLDRSLRAVERVAVSGDVAQTGSSLGGQISGCFMGLGLLAACITLLVLSFRAMASEGA